MRITQCQYSAFVSPGLLPILSGGKRLLMYGGMPGGDFGNGGYGYTTLKKGDATQQYVHVITKPSSGTSVRLRDGGYHVTKVTNLRTGASVSSSQGGGFLTISGVSTWDQYDTWSTVKSSTLPDVRGAQVIDVGRSARYVRLEVDSTYASSHTLRIDELWLASSYA
jgi:hypothetical protein